MTTTETRIAALVKHLNMEVDEDGDAIDPPEESTYGDNFFEAEGGEYLVLTDDEADEAAKDQIEDSLWAFNASFIISHSDLPAEAEEMIKGFQESKCEDANETIRSLIKDLDDFASDACSADGRGHFLAGYDGDEVEITVEDEEGTETTLFIFRTN
jgi:hypothetical protein